MRAPTIFPLFPAYSRTQLTGLLLGPFLFTLILLFFSAEGLSREGVAVLAVTVWIATWWVTEALPIPATALMPIILLPSTGALDNSTVTSAYGDDIIFLFLGGFFIATAMEKWNLHKRIALSIIAFVGTSTQRILLGFMLATTFISLWVSNTAAVMMMVPMALAITTRVGHNLRDTPEAAELPAFEKALLFGVGYAGTIGGLGVLTSTPPNIIMAGLARELFGIDVTYFGWMAVGLPIAAALVICAWFYLGRFAFPMRLQQLPGGRALIEREREELGPISFEEKAVTAVFVFTAFMWMTRTLIWTNFIPDLRDGMIATLAAILLFVIPARDEGQGTGRLLNWKDSTQIPWGILLLFGGGLAIAAGFRLTGLSSWIGSHLSILEGLHILLIIGSTTLLIQFLTEVTSNTATATMILPVVAALAVALNIHPLALMIPAAMAANCAFMMPVSTPPNAIIFATEKLRIVEMVRVGFIITLVSTVLIVLAIYFLLPAFWGLDLNTTVPKLE